MTIDYQKDGLAIDLTRELIRAGALTTPESVTESLDVLRKYAEANTAEPAKPTEPQAPAVPIKKSVTPDYIVCLEDGKKLKMLKRYLRAAHGMTPDEYRAKWGLPSDYPMVAPNHAAARSRIAKEIGLGKK